MIPLSVLDLYPVTRGATPTSAIHDSVALSKRVDELGYHRIWIAEHHNMPNIAASAPEVLIGHVAQVTKRIRVGAGGIMLPNHTPLRVLEIFRTLEALHPGRIDLGLGRAPGTDQITSAALRRPGTDVNDLLAELIAFIHKDFPESHPFSTIEAMPNDVTCPPIWMLGSTSQGASIGASLGVGFSFAGHFSMGEAKNAVATYRKMFRPSSPAMPESRLMMAVSVVCGEDDDHAEGLAAPLRVAFARMANGQKGPFPSVEEARDYKFTPSELAVVERFSKGAIIGGPKKVAEGLERIIEEFGADELMLSTVVPIQPERVRSYERVAKVWGLEKDSA